MRVAYFDVFAGIAGDMTLAALLDAGLDLNAVRAVLAGLPVGGFELRPQRVLRHGLAGCYLEVEVDPAHEAPEGRTLAEVLGILEGGTLPQSIAARSGEVFRRLASAEARVHGVELDQVRLHHVGEIDTIVDVVGCVAGLELLGVERVFSSALPTGGAGMAGGAGGHGLGEGETPPGESSHALSRGASPTREHAGHAHAGALPMPGPATLELLAAARAPLQPAPRHGPAWELVTPTGAALITTLASFERPAMSLDRIGYGAGRSDFPEIPNLLRVWIGEVGAAGESLAQVETNIDDMSPELYGHVMERLFAAGARDVWLTPIQMKKGRPGVMLAALAPESLVAAIVDAILRETSTLGVRVLPTVRHEAGRRLVRFASSLGEVGVKLKELGGQVVSVAPEYDDCRALAQRGGRPLREVMALVEREAAQRWLAGPSLGA